MDLITWFKKSHPLVVFIYVIGFISAFATYVKKDSFIYIPSGLFYQYTIYFVPIIIVTIILYLQRKPYLNYNSDGDRTWLYRQPLKFRKILRLFVNVIQVPLITIIIYYSIGVFASYFPQNYSHYAHTTTVTWKESSLVKSHYRYQYYLGTEMTDQLMPSKYKFIHAVITGFSRNYFLIKLKTYMDLNVNQQITVLRKSSLFWGDYIYDIGYTKSDQHYRNSTNQLKKKKSVKNPEEQNQEIKEKMIKHQKDFEHMIHQNDVKKIVEKETLNATYPKLIKYEKEYITQ